MHPFKISEPTIKPFYPELCTLLSRVFFCSINFCCLSVHTGPSSPHPPPPLSLFFLCGLPHIAIGQHSTSSPFSGRRQEKERKGEGQGWQGMFPNLPTSPSRAGSSTEVPSNPNYSAILCALHPFPMYPATSLYTNQSSPLLPRKKHSKTTKMFCNWQKGKRQQEKGCVVNTLCPAWHRKFTCIFPNSQEQSRIRTYSTTMCIHPSHLQLPRQRRQQF